MLGASVAGTVSLAQLSEDQVSELSQLIGLRPDTYLGVCVRHPQSQQPALLACLVNFPAAADPDQLVQIAQHSCSYVSRLVFNSFL